MKNLYKLHKVYSYNRYYPFGTMLSLILLFAIICFSCKGNKTLETAVMNTFKDSMRAINDNDVKNIKTKDNLNNFILIDANSCIDNSRHISPVVGYLRIGKGVPTVRMESFFDTSKILEGLLFVNVIDSVSGQLIQKINLSDIKLNKHKDSNTISFTEIHFDYFNLDDYIDIYLLQSCGAHGPCYGYYFFYDKAKHEYVYAIEYDKLFNVSVNKKKNVIYSSDNSGLGYWTYKTFKLIRKKLKLVECETLNHIDTDDNAELYRYIYRKRNVKGKFLKVEEKDTSQFVKPKYFMKY